MQIPVRPECTINSIEDSRRSCEEGGLLDPAGDEGNGGAPGEEGLEERAHEEARIPKKFGRIRQSTSKQIDTHRLNHRCHLAKIVYPFVTKI